MALYYEPLLRLRLYGPGLAAGMLARAALMAALAAGTLAAAALAAATVTLAAVARCRSSLQLSLKKSALPRQLALDLEQLDLALLPLEILRLARVRGVLHQLW